MGIQILNKDVSVISSVMGKPKASIGNIFGKIGWAGGGTFVPGDFNFADGNVDYTTNTVIFTKSGRLYIEGYSDQTVISAGGYLNDASMNFFTSTADAIANPNNFEGDPGAPTYAAALIWGARYGVFDVVAGNTMYFDVFNEEPLADVGYISFRITSFTGTLIDSFTANWAGGCYLTTATVQYKGLLDNGPELMAMRQLREHYRGDVYYDDLITEYYQNSPTILNGINSSIDPSSEYEFIYQSVLRVKAFVDIGQWEQAKDEYINTYLILKNRYITNV